MTRSRLVSLLAVLATSAFTTTAMAGPSQLPSLVPANPNAGECYARVKIPAQYTTSREAYVSDQAHTQLQVRQARLQARQEAVMTKDAHTRYHIRQPRFQTVTDQILVRPAYDKLSVTPPQFQTIQENIQTSAPTLVWKKGTQLRCARRDTVFIQPRKAAVMAPMWGAVIWLPFTVRDLAGSDVERAVRFGVWSKNRARAVRSPAES
ncbi:hypothetical protein AB8615_00870 [Litorimonas sp. RW-G-Af-16]|uniref:hypothetical protein n=1 Tax=Litorimonas sp. RW-G-Af-16 TaxID=3241168 RepID=UPI003AAFFFA9